MDDVAGDLKRLHDNEFHDVADREDQLVLAIRQGFCSACTSGRKAATVK